MHLDSFLITHSVLHGLSYSHLVHFIPYKIRARECICILKLFQCYVKIFFHCTHIYILLDPFRHQFLTRQSALVAFGPFFTFEMDHFMKLNFWALRFESFLSSISWQWNYFNSFCPFSSDLPGFLPALYLTFFSVRLVS